MSYRNDNVEKFIMNNSFLTKSVLKATRVLQFDVISHSLKAGRESIKSNCNTLVALEDENNVSPNNSNNSDKKRIILTFLLQVFLILISYLNFLIFLILEDLAFVLYVEWIESVVIPTSTGCIN